MPIRDLLHAQLTTASAVVLSTNCPHALKETARAARGYLGDRIQICAGTNDEGPIQAAINSLTVGRPQKETVKLIGDFNLGASVNLDSYCRLDLQEATLSVAAGVIGIYIPGRTHAEVIGGLIDGNGNSSYLIAEDGACTYIAIRHVRCHDSGDHAILINASDAQSFVKVKSCIITSPSGGGIVATGASASELLFIEDNSVSGIHDTATAFGIWIPGAGWDNARKSILNNVVLANGANVTGGDHFGLRGNNGTLRGNRAIGAFADGFAIGVVGQVASDWIISDNKASNSGTQGFMLYRVSLSSFNGNHAIGNTAAGFYLAGCSYCTFASDHSRNNTGVGFRLLNDSEGVPAGSIGNSFSACRAANNSVDLSEEGLSDHNIYKGGHVETVATVGAGTRVDNNVPAAYRTENHGMSTGTGAQQTIAHGLSFTPTADQIILWDIETGAAPYHSAPPDATNIYVTATINQDWGWSTVP